VIKAWHLHRVMTLNYAVVQGMIKLVLYDAREGSLTHGELQELFVGDANYALVTVPPGVWNGFKGCGVVPAIVANCATHAHDPDEIVREDPFGPTVPYDWALRHG
jgi:dTDP-4-dehydrorhamnose 3,5-epimerase